MSRRRAIIPQRRVIFIGCEGASEVGYAGLLQDFALADGLHIHLSIHELGPGAGDPLARVEMAVRRLKLLRRTREVPAERFAMLDRDQADRDPARAERAQRLADDNDIQIVWQEPCFEGVLLRHLEGHATRRPPDTPRATKALSRDWPDYRKPMTRAMLARQIDIAAVRRAATVEPGLAAMLRCLGILEDEA